MSHNMKEDQFSDDEVFFGKLSLKEIKKHIIWNNSPQKRMYTCAIKEEYDNDIKIIETHSAPNLRQRDKDVLSNDIKPVSSSSISPNGQDIFTEWEVKPVNDSFLKVEQMVENLSVSSNKVIKKDELNNTLDIIDYILKNGNPKTTENTSGKCNEVKPTEEVCTNKTNMDNKDTVTSSKQCDKWISEADSVPKSPAYFTPTKKELKIKKTERFLTPFSNLKPRTFKTPVNPMSIKKPINSIKKTPIKNNAYQHIASPIASYIKNCPVAPLVKDVRPTKPLPGPSSIPKFLNKTPAYAKQSNKENVRLPNVAYKCAKKTQVIAVPDDKLPPSLTGLKKISSLPKPLIMKHNHREMNSAKKVLGSRLEDSCADLTLKQAEVSVCTQKSAFNKPKV